MNRDVEAELDALAGENIALQMVVIGLCRALADRDIRAVFDDADEITERVALAVGNKARPEHIANAFRVVEQLREAVFPAERTGQRKPRRSGA